MIEKKVASDSFSNKGVQSIGCDTFVAFMDALWSISVDELNVSKAILRRIAEQQMRVDRKQKKPTSGISAARSAVEKPALPFALVRNNHQWVRADAIRSHFLQEHRFLKVRSQIIIPGHMSRSRPSLARIPALRFERLGCEGRGSGFVLVQSHLLRRTDRSDQAL